MVTTLEKIKRVLKGNQYTDEVEISPTHLLNEDLGLDSLDSVELTMDLEEVFNTEISDEQFRNVETVMDIVILLDRRIK